MQAQEVLGATPRLTSDRSLGQLREALEMGKFKTLTVPYYSAPLLVGKRRHSATYTGQPGWAQIDHFAKMSTTRRTQAYHSSSMQACQICSDHLNAETRHPGPEPSATALQLNERLSSLIEPALPRPGQTKPRAAACKGFRGRASCPSFAVYVYGSCSSVASPRKFRLMNEGTTRAAQRFVRVS